MKAFYAGLKIPGKSNPFCVNSAIVKQSTLSLFFCSLFKRSLFFFAQKIDVSVRQQDMS